MTTIFAKRHSQKLMNREAKPEEETKAMRNILREYIGIVLNRA